jgi:hypothetical protein
MAKKLFWIWLLANGLSPVLLVVAGVFFGTNIVRVNALLPWGSGADVLLPLAAVVCVVVSVLLPGLVIRKINPKVPLWLYVLGVACYPLVWVFLSGRTQNMRYAFGTWSSVDRAFWIVINKLPDDGLPYPWQLPLTLAAVVTWPFLCSAPMMLLSFLRERHWRFPLRLGLALTVASFVSGVAGLLSQWIVLGMMVHFRFAQHGFDSLNERDIVALLFWGLPTALGAMASFVLLSPNPARHHPQTFPP